MKNILKHCPIPFTEREDWPGIDDKNIKCIVQIIYPDDVKKLTTWCTEGLVLRKTQLTNTNGENITLKFYVPPDE